MANYRHSKKKRMLAGITVLVLIGCMLATMIISYFI